MTKTLTWIHTHPRIVWPALLIYAILVSLPHAEVQDWLANAIKPMGYPAFYRIMASAALTTATILTWLAYRARPGRAVIIGWAITLLLSLFAWRILSVNNSELIHFGQYALPGLVLFALTRSVADALAWIIIMAGFDEGYQFWGIHPDWGIPLDFNDIYMDLLGGALGILFGLGYLPTNPPKRRPGLLLLGAIFSASAVLLALGRLLIYEQKGNTYYWTSLSRMPPKGFWFYDETWGPRTIHSLTPPEGIVLILLTFAAYSYLDRRSEVRGQ